MEVEQRLKTAEDDLALLRRDDSVFALSNATKRIDGGSGRLDVDVDELLQALYICPLRSENIVSSVEIGG